ncbi:MAG: helix-turn-helix domain-containing protein [Pasteurella oralis]|uniref:winged helix-turn-helix transcriptional regulator n=1 Tax=Pasteurella oralis TaxID=1071947 RepID=UPI000C79B02C|nr:helix-turn-helix domain-containing protein [Pasteurella oralis]MDO5053739.1 helix-turn-helix domain-containing protein [Pasteurella oralis]
MSINYEQCPYITTQKVLQGKWAIVVLYHLNTGTKRFNQLEKLIPQATRTVLTRQLRQLEKDKLVERKVFAEVPPRVEYSLTELGMQFQQVLTQIEIFGLTYITTLKSLKK